MINKFSPAWYTIPQFADTKPLCMYHKEQENVQTESNGVQNLHVLARADFSVETLQEQKLTDSGFCAEDFGNTSRRYFLRISADDYYKLYINGQYVAEGPAPAYIGHYYYNEIDITDYLTEGKNVFALHLYYQGLVNRVWNSGDNRFGVGAEVLCLEMRQADLQSADSGADIAENGTDIADSGADIADCGADIADSGAHIADRNRTEELCWRYRISEAYSGETIGYETQFLENFDSRKWDMDWAMPDYEEKGFAPMVKAEWADYTFYPQPTKMLAVYRKEPVECFQVLLTGEEKRIPEADIADSVSETFEMRRKISVSEISEKQQKISVAESAGIQRKMVFDMGEEVTGTLRICAEGKAGQKIIIRCGEELLSALCASRTFAQDNVINTMNEACGVRYDMRCNCRYEEEWTLTEGESVLEQYDYKAFRYIELITDEAVEIKEVWLNVRHYPMEETCTFTCEKKELEDIFRICKNAVRYGTQEGYLDCPTREKGQYLGDAIVTAHAQVWLTGSTEMLRKCIAQFAETSMICKGLMAVAPGALMQEIADFSLLWSQLLLLDYQFTADKTFLARYYPVAKGIIEHFMQYEREDGLLYQVADKWNLVDWPENLRDDYDFTLSRPIVAEGCHNVINALYVGALKTLSQIEEILELPQSYQWEKYREAFFETFYNKESGLFTDSEGSSHSAVHSNIYPLYFGFLQEEQIPAVVQMLEKKGLCCGVFVSYFMLRGLAKAGYSDVMYRLLVNESEHGWVNMLREGATTCFEAWGKEQKWNTSLCHPWASAPIPLIIEELAGFHPVIAGEGELSYEWKPYIPKELGQFRLEFVYAGKAYRIIAEADGEPVLICE